MPITGPSRTTHMSPTRKLVNLGLTSIHGAHCLAPVNNFQTHKQNNQSYQGWREVTSRHDSPPNADIHFAPERGGWGSLQRRHVSALPPAPSSVGQAATTRAGTECGCGHQGRTLQPLVNQRQGMGVQLIKLSRGNVRGFDSECSAASNSPLFKRRLSLYSTEHCLWECLWMCNYSTLWYKKPKSAQAKEVFDEYLGHTEVL